MSDIVTRLLAGAVATKHVNQSGEWDCLERRDGLNEYGYSTIKVRGRTWKAHRLVWTHLVGDITAGQCVLHKCDNRCCVNVTHLFLGTKGDNNADRHAKGRSGGGAPRGTGNGHAKLTDGTVKEIRERYRLRTVSQRALAKEYGISRWVISDVIARRTWTHIAETRG